MDAEAGPVAPEIEPPPKFEADWTWAMRALGAESWLAVVTCAGCEARTSTRSKPKQPSAPTTTPRLAASSRPRACWMREGCVVVERRAF